METKSSSRLAWSVAVVFLAIEFCGAVYGWFVGVGFMHGRIAGWEGALVWLVVALYASIPISILVGVVAFILRRWK